MIMDGGLAVLHYRVLNSCILHLICAWRVGPGSGPSGPGLADV